MKNRLDYIDEMKGFAILLVTMGHIYLPYTQESHNHPIAQMIYSFHMAFFYFLSGFILAKTYGRSKKGDKIFILKKLQTLILPWLSFSLIVPFFLHRGTNYVFDFDKLFFYPVNGYWFLPLLFIFMVMWLLADRIISKARGLNNFTIGGGNLNLILLLNIFIICLVAITGFVLHLYHIIIYAIYYAAFIFGYLVAKEENIALVIMENKLYGICSLLLILMWKLGPVNTYGGIAWRSMFNLCHTFICSMSASIVFFNLFHRIQLPYMVKRYLQETGKLSLAIYLIPVVLLPTGFLFPDNWTPAFTNIAILTISVVVNIVCYWIGRGILEIPYLKFILFGKK